MLLVGSSLGAAVAIDLAVNHPEAVSMNDIKQHIFWSWFCIIVYVKGLILMFLQVDKLILLDASVYAEGTGSLSRLPKFVAYAGVSIFNKSINFEFFTTT